jgi:OmpA-OmpF porin, OOP family
VTDKEIVILDQVQFKTGSAEILAASDDLLTQVASVLAEHPEILKVEVQGHTDNRGGKAMNQKLSQKRSAAVLTWLVKRGKVDASRLTSRGYGMEQPIADNDTDEGRQKNRRVQFKITEKTSAKPEASVSA